MNTNLERERIRTALRRQPIPIPTLAIELGVDIAVIEAFVTTNANLTAEHLSRLAAILASRERRPAPVPVPVPAPDKRKPVMTLTTRAIKCTLVLNTSGLLAIPNPVNGAARVVLKVAVDDGRTVTADIASKSIRKCKNVIHEHGAENVSLLIQGKLGASNQIEEAGLVAQVKVQKPEKEKENVST